jgi:hypothetical protein
LRLGGNVYNANPSERNEPPSRFSTDQLPNCFRGEPQTVVLKLLCANVFNDGHARLEVEGVTEFEGRKLRSLALIGPDTTTRLLVDPTTYLPVAQTLTSHDQGSDALIRTLYVVEMTKRDTLSADFFDPRSIGYVGP